MLVSRIERACTTLRSGRVCARSAVPERFRDIDRVGVVTRNLSASWALWRLVSTESRVVPTVVAIPRCTHGGGRSRVVPTVVGDPSFHVSSCRAVCPLKGENGLRGATRRSSGGRPYNRPRWRWGELASRRWRPWSRRLSGGRLDRWHSRARSAARSSARSACSYFLSHSFKLRKEAWVYRIVA